MTTAYHVSFGVKTSQANTTYEDVLRTWLEADGIPVFEHAWLWDHLVPLRGDVTGPALEAWTLLAALAAQTERLQLGVIVTSNRLRAPALLAKMAATVDRISNGRLVFGIGAGGSAVKDPAGLALVRREHDAYGIPVVPTGEAIDALDEACTIVERLWTETAGTISSPARSANQSPSSSLGRRSSSAPAVGEACASSPATPISGTARLAATWRWSETSAASSTTPATRLAATRPKSSGRCSSSSRARRSRRRPSPACHSSRTRRPLGASYSSSSTPA